MLFKVLRRLAISALVCALFTQASAQTRTWWYRHVAVHNQSGETTIEASVIASTDAPTTPQLVRILSQDPAGRRFVLRNEVSGDSIMFSLTSIATGEVLRVEGTVDGTMQMWYGGNSITFQDGQETSQTVRDAATNLVANATQSFMNGLQYITVLGLNESILYHSFAYSLRQLLFSTLPVPTEPREGDGVVTIIRDFNPITTPPSAFDAQFGTAYYE